MNWNHFQTYGDSPDKAFEMLCNQLFEKWCRSEYQNSVSSFRVVNGAGGDGGIESYAVLNNGNIIGLQAKWFLTSMQDSQIQQIRHSIEEAKKVRPQITHYIVCIPRNLASETNRPGRTESDRWFGLVSDMNQLFPGMEIELWDDARITGELQGPNTAGILMFWFQKAEIDSEIFLSAFERAKASWLSTRYVPDINAVGIIHQILLQWLGDFDDRTRLMHQFSKNIELCSEFVTVVDSLLSIPHKNDEKDMIHNLQQYRAEIHEMEVESTNIKHMLEHEETGKQEIRKSVFPLEFYVMLGQMDDLLFFSRYAFHKMKCCDIFRKLTEMKVSSLVDEAEQCFNQQPILFLGNPGTGKTQGVSSVADELLKQGYHIPVMVQAGSIPKEFSWKEIIIKALGISSDWGEEELWQALSSAACRNRFRKDILSSAVSILPKILIIVDGIDESSKAEKWIERMGEAACITEKYPQIRFCYTSRPTAFSGRIETVREIHLPADGDASVLKLFDVYTKAYNISIQQCAWVKYVLNTPLALKLFCELYKDQKVSINDLPEATESRLWRRKIDIIQREFSHKASVSPKDQHVLLAITALAQSFTEKNVIERHEAVRSIKNAIPKEEFPAEDLLDHLETYGVLTSHCYEGTGLAPNSYCYYPGIQGYFEYAGAFLLTDSQHPSEIDFGHLKGLNASGMYCLAVISMQKFHYLITKNKTIERILNPQQVTELFYYALQHSSPEDGAAYRNQILEIMENGADALVTVLNTLILPLSRISGHPLGSSLLDQYLQSFKQPAQRDIVWSLPKKLFQSDGTRWAKNADPALLGKEEYGLNDDDRSDGLPVIYAWMLSSVSNPVRKECRKKLMAWAMQSPEEYYQLFLRFAENNDPQIRSDLFSILMCLVYEIEDTAIIRKAAEWVIQHVLSPSCIDRNRDISVRYYAIGILRRAKQAGMIQEDISQYLPPYSLKNKDIDLSQDALTGTRMEGYKAIHYDLARYVLADHFDAGFNLAHSHPLDQFLKEYGEENREFANISSEQFVISAAYAYILHMGWNEFEFYDCSMLAPGQDPEGADWSIVGTHPAATHGKQSQVMTVCEKYIWAARNEISGYLCDRIPFGEEKIHLSDYSLLEHFVIPSQEICEKKRKNLTEQRVFYPFQTLENEILNDSQSNESYEDFIENTPDIDWEKCIYITTFA